MNKKSFKVALVGCGRVAQHYLKIIKQIKKIDIKIDAVCDVKKDKAIEISKKINSKPYFDLKKMLKEIKVDLIIILTPSGMHYDHSNLALNYGFNVLVEKPICLLISDAKKLYKKAKRKKLALSVGFQNRHNKAIVFLKKAVNKKLFGKIVSVSVVLRWCRFQSYYSDDWHGTWEFDGGVINQQAIHHIDALNYIFGPIKKVSSFISKRLNKLEAEDTCVSAIELSDGALCTLEATTAARPKDFEASITVVGEKGMAKIGGIGLNKIDNWEMVNKKIDLKKIKKQNSEKFNTGYGTSHKKIIPLFLNQTRNRKKNYENIVHSISTLKLIHSIYSSSERSKIIKISSNINSRKLGRQSDIRK